MADDDVARAEAGLYQLPKGATLKAQRIFRQAYKRLARECELDKRPDVWVVIATVSLSAVVTELAAQGKRLRDDRGIDAIVKHACGSLEEALRRDLGEYLAAEAKQARH